MPERPRQHHIFTLFSSDVIRAAISPRRSFLPPLHARRQFDVAMLLILI